MKASPELASLSRAVSAEAARDPSRTIATFIGEEPGSESVTAADLAAKTDSVAAGFLKAGLRPGAVVGLMLHNHPECLFSLLASSKLGVAVLPINPHLPSADLADLLSVHRPAGIVTADYIVAHDDVAEVIRSSESRVWALSTPEGQRAGLDSSYGWRSLNEELTRPAKDAPDEHVADPDTTFLRLYGPGTGPVSVSHAQLSQYRQATGWFGYQPDDVAYTPLRLTSLKGMVATLLPALWGSISRAVFCRSVDPARLWEICIENGCTTWSGDGSIAAAVYLQPSSAQDRRHGVRLVVTAGMPRDIWRPFESRFGVRLLEWYTSRRGGFAYNSGGGPVGSFGKSPGGQAEMDVVDDAGHSVPPGQLGELVLRGPGLPPAWVATGDMVVRDDRGWHYYAHPTERSRHPWTALSLDGEREPAPTS